MCSSEVIVVGKGPAVEEQVPLRVIQVFDVDSNLLLRLFHLLRLVQYKPNLREWNSSHHQRMDLQLLRVRCRRCYMLHAAIARPSQIVHTPRDPVFEIRNPLWILSRVVQARQGGED